MTWLTVETSNLTLTLETKIGVSYVVATAVAIDVAMAIDVGVDVHGVVVEAG